MIWTNHATRCLPELIRLAEWSDNPLACELGRRLEELQVELDYPDDILEEVKEAKLKGERFIVEMKLRANLDIKEVTQMLDASVDRVGELESKIGRISEDMDEMKNRLEGEVDNLTDKISDLERANRDRPVSDAW